MKLSETLDAIQHALEAGTVTEGYALVMLIEAFRADIERAEREDVEAADRSVGG